MLVAPDPAIIPLHAQIGAQLLQGNINDKVADIKNSISQKKNWFQEALDRKRSQFAYNKAVSKEELDRKQAAMEKRRVFYQKIAKGVKYFNSQMQMAARFYPIILLVLGIIAVFSGIFKYILMGIAYLAIILVKVWYFIGSLPPFFQIAFVPWFIVVDLVPFLIFTAIFMALLIFIIIFCCLLAIADVCTGGSLKVLALCQNSPGAWYTVPNFHMTNEYSRGLFCSFPCRASYAPDTTGTSCVRQAKQNPSFCTYAQIMRFYTGVGKSDSVYIYDTFKYKGNMKFIQKPPTEKERFLFDYFLEGKRHKDRCDNPDKRFSFRQHIPMVKNICSNLDGFIKYNRHNLTKEDVDKMRKVCTQAFCNSTTAYPFCMTLTSSDSLDQSGLIRRIILALIAIMVFILTIFYVIYYMGNGE